MKRSDPESKSSLLWTLKSAFVVWLRPLDFTKRDQIAFVIVNTLIIDLFVLLTVWPETLISGVSPWIPALFGIATATPLAIIMMTLGGNSLREILKLRADMESISTRLTERNMELEVARSELDRLANSDGLTGIANRRSFSITLNALFEASPSSGTETWLAMLDLDGFKAINDTYGHDAGDSVLITISERLHKAFKNTDGKIARLGGDEFALLWHERKSHGADIVERRARALCAYLTAGHEYEGTSLDIGVSLGLTQLGDGFATPGDFLKAADNALLRAKAGGKGRICRYTPDTVPPRKKLLRRG